MSPSMRPFAAPGPYPGLAPRISPSDSLTDLASGGPWPASVTAPVQGLARRATRAGWKDLTAPIAQGSLTSVQ
jgi:hypothetical protein